MLHFLQYPPTTSKSMSCVLRWKEIKNRGANHAFTCLLARLYDLFGEQFIDVIPLMKHGYVKKLVKSGSDHYLIKVNNPKKAFDDDDDNDCEDRSALRVKFNYCFLLGNFCNCSFFRFKCKLAFIEVS